MWTRNIVTVVRASENAVTNNNKKSERNRERAERVKKLNYNINNRQKKINKVQYTAERKVSNIVALKTPLH